MKMIKKAWDVAKLTGRDPLVDMVHNHNMRIHPSTVLTPSQYLMGRQIRTRFPCQMKMTQDEDRDKAREKALKTQEDQKARYDSKRNVRPNDIKVGDLVFKAQKKTKEKPPSVSTHLGVQSPLRWALPLTTIGDAYARHHPMTDSCHLGNSTNLQFVHPTLHCKLPLV